MDKTVNAGDDLCKCAELENGNDLSVNYVANVVLFGEDLPRIVFLGLVAQRDTLFLGVYGLDVNFDRIAYVKQLGGSLESAPGQLGNVYETVYGTDVYECAEICKRTNGTGELLICFEGSVEIFDSLLAFCSCNDLDRAYSSLSALLIADLDNLAASCAR